MMTQETAPEATGEFAENALVVTVHEIEDDYPVTLASLRYRDPESPFAVRETTATENLVALVGLAKAVAEKDGRQIVVKMDSGFIWYSDCGTLIPRGVDRDGMVLGTLLPETIPDASMDALVEILGSTDQAASVLNFSRP